MRHFRSDELMVRGRRCHVRIWDGSEPAHGDAPTLFFLHGWGDVGASFQFVVDALPADWRVIAPDWRGFGGSQWNDGAYWFLDYLADLDVLLAHYAADRPVNLVGHSLGGIVASLYAGVRPQRVARFANLEGFGLWVSTPEETPGRLGQWLDEVVHGDPAFRAYPTREAFAARLRRDNPRLSAERAAFLAEHSLRQAGDDFIFSADPQHRWLSPALFPLPDAMACWRQIRAKTLWVAARQSKIMKQFIEHPDEFERRLACFAGAELAWIDDCGHNLHHDEPEGLAHLLTGFFADVGRAADRETRG